MRTKTLLLTAALSAAGIATSMAQAVYSVNAVGYVNTTLAPGFNLISNPLDNKTGNTIANLFGTGMNPVPEGLIVYHFDPATDQYVSAVYDPFLGGWDPVANANTVIAPGNGVFVFLPGAANSTVTFVGEVPQGNLSNPLPQGFSIKASQVPQAGTVSTQLGYPAAEGDIFYTYNTTAKRYDSAVFDPFLGGWDPAEPTLAVGQAAFVFRPTAGTWTRNFNVNQ
jgi:hypothetical protein